MTRLVAGLVLCLLPLQRLPLPAQTQSDRPSPFAKAQSKKADKTVTLTGCLDQRGSRFFLAEAEELKPVAELRGDAIPEESFAKHLGHRVSVRGVLVSGGETPLIRVRQIRTLAETCARDN